MKNMQLTIVTLLVFLMGCGSDNNVVDAITPKIEIDRPELKYTAQASSQNVKINANAKWIVSSNQSWCFTSTNEGFSGQSVLTIQVASNRTAVSRTAILSFSVGSYSKQFIVKQDAGETINTVPAGYALVWQDEFNQTANNLPNNEWWFETGNHGWGNNERQNYVNKIVGADTVAKIKNGMLIISAIKLATPYQGSEIISARMNTSKSWTYGYFEMSAKLPAGKGTWAAFWMMPQNYQSWPLDGEIDIMEYVGYKKNVTHSTIHTQAYNHKIGTEKTATKQIENAETDFHVYGLEWTADQITGFVDGVAYFNFKNDKTGKKETWPFNQAFYLKLNLAIGGDWGGLEGVDTNIFPSQYHIDYVRVYQK